MKFILLLFLFVREAGAEQILQVQEDELESQQQISSDKYHSQDQPGEDDFLLIPAPRQPVYISAAIWPSPKGFSGIFGLGYFLSPYLATELNSFYKDSQEPRFSLLRYGADLNLILWGRNKTMVTPFLGNGVGFERWRQEHSEAKEMISIGSSPNFLAFMGVRISLTKYFGIMAERRYRRYLNSVPKSYEVGENKHKNFTVGNQFGFFMML